MMHSIARIAFVASIVATALTLAACADRPREDLGTPVQPTAEASPTSAPGAVPAAGAAPAPGATIRWNESGSTAGTTANNGSAPSANSPDSAPGTALPPGTILPPGAIPDNAPVAGADSGTIRWNTPQSAPATVPGAPVGPPVNWRTGIQGDVVWVEIIDPASFYRVDRVDLVAPDGRAFAASDVSRTQARYDYTAGSGSGVGLGVGSWGGSRHSGTSVGLGIGFPLGGGGRGYEREDNATRSVARFQLADPQSYQRTASAWSVNVRLLDRNGHSSVARFPAPVTMR